MGDQQVMRLQEAGESCLLSVRTGDCGKVLYRK